MLKIAKHLIAAALVMIGLYLAVFGNSWGPLFFERLETTEIGLWLELVVPFLPLVFIGFGATLFVSGHRTRKA